MARRRRQSSRTPAALYVAAVGALGYALRLVLRRMRSTGRGSTVLPRNYKEALRKEEIQQLEAAAAEFDGRVLVPALKKALELNVASAGPPREPPPPAANVVDPEEEPASTKAAWRKSALRLIHEGRCASILLAGGQGTRLGADCPKGCLTIGLPSQATLFELHAMRLRRLAVVAAESEGKGASPKGIPWYIMTSDATHAETVAHFKENSYYGLDPNDVVFFPQGMLPALTKDGVAVLTGVHVASHLSLSPDGNGGIYQALLKHGVLDDMRRRRVVCCDAICVDNVLARPLEPGFVGCCLARNADMGALAVEKAYAHEKVGVFVEAPGNAGGLSVCEYSEMPKASSEEMGPGNKLKYRWGNVCIHFYTADFLNKMASTAINAMLPYHAAIKQVPGVAGEKVEAVKLERFIFDAFAFAKNATLYAAKREDAFAPIKNKAGPGVKDSPETARKLLCKQHARWLRKAGAFLLDPPDSEYEIAPGATYDGDGLEAVVEGMRLEAGLVIL